MKTKPRVPTRFERWSPLQRGSALLLTVLLLSAILLLLAEAAVEIRAKLRYGSFWGIEQTYTVEPASGLRIPIPGDFGHIVINSHGFRSPEITQDKPTGRLRIAFLGGSTTFCAEVSSNEATWPSLVWKAMHERWPGLDLDYINAGVPGYSTSTMLRALEARVAAFRPDIIVLYEATNDLSGNSFNLAKEQGVVKTHQEEELSWLSRHSLLAYLIGKNLEVRRQQRLADSPTGKITLDMKRLDDQFRQDYEKLIEASAKVAKIVVTVTFSSRMRREQSEAERSAAAVTSLYYMPYMRVDDIITGFEHYNAIIRDLAAAHGTLLVGDENSIPPDGQHFMDSVHFTDAGSVLMAKRVYEAILASPKVQALVASAEEKGTRN
jgi:lysophospholipase L1-like esterase